MLLLPLLLAVLIGIIAGTFTGLAPGIHVNLVAAMLVAFAPSIIPVFGALTVCCFIISMATTHAFLDVLPSIFLGAPESATALGVLPGHRYLLRGNGLMAIKLTLIGSIGGLVLCGLLYAPLLPLLALVYPFISGVMGFLILAVALFMILRDRTPAWALFIFVLSGVLGCAVFEIPGLGNPLFPLLSGLFGVATLLTSLNESENIPPQDDLPYTELDGKRSIQALGSGTFSGFLTAVLPGIGAATAAVISLQITRKLGDHGFLVLMGAISTANFVLSLVALQALDKARNGAVVAVQALLDVNAAQVLLFLFVALIAGGLATIIALWTAQRFVRLLNKVSYKKLVIGVLALILLLAPILSGWQGVLVLIVSTAVGLLPAIKKVSRTHGMGCIMVPVMVYFLIP